MRHIENIRRRLQQALGRGSSRNLLASLGAASIWQISNYLIPLVTLPYLARTLGASGFGALSFSIAVVAYANLLTDWGFIYTATQSASRMRTQPEALNRLVWSVLAAKVLLGALSGTILIAICVLTSRDQLTLDTTIASMIGLLGTMFNLDWLLRGTERIKHFTIISVLGRSISIPLVLLFVRTSDDLPKAAMALAISGPITAALTMVVAHRAGLIQRPQITIAAVIERITDGIHVFLSTAMINVYTNSMAVILGATSTPFQLGQFSGADKVRRPIQSMLSPIGIVFFPHINHLLIEDPTKAQAICRKLLKVQGLIALAMSLGSIIAAPLAIRILLGSQFDQAIPVFQVLSMTTVLIGVSNVLGLMIMLPFGLKKEFMGCVTGGAVVGLTLSILLSLAWGALGIASAAVIAEICVTLSMYFTLKRKLDWF